MHMASSFLEETKNLIERMRGSSKRKNLQKDSKTRSYISHEKSPKHLMVKNPPSNREFQLRPNFI